MKKLLCTALMLALIMSLCGCFKIDVADVSSDNSNTVNSENDDDVSENSTPVSSNISQSQSPAKPQGNASQISSTPSGAVVEKPIIPTVSDDEIVSFPEIEQPTPPNTPHIPLSKESYYQYSHLSVSDKQVYSDICQAIETTQNVINLKKYSLSPEKVKSIYEKVMADNPQYF